MATANEIPEGIKAPTVSPEAKKSALDELMSGDFMTKMREQIAGIREKVGTEISNFKKKNAPEKIETPKKTESVQPKENPNTTPESEVVLNPNAPYQVSGESTANTSNIGIANSGVAGGSSGPSVSSNPSPNLSTNSF